jgi:hypothetical protein
MFLAFAGGRGRPLSRRKQKITGGKVVLRACAGVLSDGKPWLSA